MIYQRINITNSFPILPALLLLFVGLKLTDVIDWSWWWVTAPIWAVPAVVVVIIAVYAAIAFWPKPKKKIRPQKG